MVQASDYKKTVDGWDSYQDVAEWIKSNWRFDQGRARDVVSKLRRKGPSAAVAKSSEETFDLRRGWCKDAARFAKDTLNTMDPAYKAGYIFIKNKMGPPHHWVTGFRSNGKLYVMDYGAGSEWRGMMGVHGPYDSIDEYGEFLSTVKARNFKFGSVVWASDDKTNGKNYNAAVRVTKVLEKFDRNSDDKISYDEAPKPMKKGFKNLDVNGDEYLDGEELLSLPPLQK